jgi:hypothetical protein
VALQITIISSSSFQIEYCAMSSRYLDGGSMYQRGRR